MPVGSFQKSGVTVSGVFISEQVRLRCFLLPLRTDRPRSCMDDSDMFRLCTAVCEAIGSLFSVFGEPRRSTALEGEAAPKGVDTVDSGVALGRLALGDRLVSIVLVGVPPGVIMADAMSCIFPDFALSLRGPGDALRSTDGDFGGT